MLSHLASNLSETFPAPGMESNLILILIRRCFGDSLDKLKRQFERLLHLPDKSSWIKQKKTGICCFATVDIHFKNSDLQFCDTPYFAFFTHHGTRDLPPICTNGTYKCSTP